jgi:hypothetical protein
LIYPDDAKEFSGIIDVVWQSLGRNSVDKTTKQYWFSKLQHLPMGDVSALFDKWLLTEKELPTINDILHMAKPRDYYKQLPAPKNMESSIEGLKKMEKAISQVSKKTDMRHWAKVIIANPKNYPDISLKLAREAMGVKS